MKTETVANRLSDILSLLTDSDSDVSGAEICDETIDTQDGTENSQDTQPADIKSGIYSIVYTGILDGLEHAYESGNMDIDAIIDETKKATLEKARETVPDAVCDKLHARVSTHFESKRSDPKGMSGTGAFVNDSAETFANIGIDNLHGVLRGDVDISDAFSNTVSDGTKIIAGKAKDEIINSALDKTQISKYFDPSELACTAQNVKECFTEYLDGNINGTQFFLKAGENGLYDAAQKWGQSIGKSLASSFKPNGLVSKLTSAASSTIVTAVYAELYKYALNVFEEEAASKQRLEYIRALSEEAVNVIRAERKFLIESIYSESEKRQRVFTTNLISFSQALETGNIDKIVESLNNITQFVGGTVQYKNFDEFEAMMLDDSITFEL